ncbi:MAG: peptidoglycan-binding protein [Gammaproteobacteria bacterium]|nr:peptidoglycan-binding protein [Gammaproteobacteria bacterium]
MLKIGSSGQSVRDLQETLNLVVPLSPLLIVDGLFGPRTSGRVVMFQKQAGLIADGIVGPKTGKALVGGALTQLGIRQT